MVNAALIPAANAGTANEVVVTTMEQPAASDGTGNFRTVCDYSHLNFDDPILAPGVRGSTFLNVYFGNTGVNAGSTSATIASTGNSTCRGGILNRTAYWMSAMIDTRTGAPVRPGAVNHFYYKTGYLSVAPSTVVAMPLGLRVVAGYANLTQPRREAGRQVVKYYCESAGEGSASDAIANCGVGDTLWVSVEFPQCWDGVNLDAPDHRSHMAYALAGRGCPASHPVAMPQVTFKVLYPITQANQALNWRLSSDGYQPTQGNRGYSGQAGWINGWRQDIMNTWVTRCNNPALDCHSHLLGDGRAIW